MPQSFSDAFGLAQQWLFEHLVQPLMFHAGFANLLEDGYAATGWLLVGLLQIGAMLVVLGALERWRPAEPVTDRAAVREDIVYTLLHKLGLLPLLMFFTLDPLWDAGIGFARVEGLPTFQLDQLLPGVTDVAWVSFGLYLLLFDFVDYLVHRGQHGFRWWWQLHALHHSQRQMTLWSDDRNHLLDDAIRDGVKVLAGLAFGVAPAQFVALVVLAQLVESLSHANVRLSFGRVGERLLVGPRFHRLHHAIGIGHESRGPGSLGGCNFAALFPVWDLLFGTARFDARLEPTGIRDQLPEHGARDYGRGFWQQQWRGLERLVAAAPPATIVAAAILARMKELLDAFWRATAYCLHPRVIVLSLLPLALAAGSAVALGWFFWEPTVDAVRITLDGWLITSNLLDWLDSLGATGFRAVLAPLIVVALAVPVIVIVSLLLVAVLMTPAIVSLVAKRRFPALEQRHGGGWWQSAAWSLGCTLLALVALVASIPLWFIPPLVLVVPPLIWGWLTYRVMAFDVLAEHATVDERRALIREHRWPLMAMGVITGYLGAAPSLVWAVGAATVIFAPVLVVVSIWLYTLVFAFSALWFAHYALALLERRRLQAPAAEVLPPLASPDAAAPASLLPH